MRVARLAVAALSDIADDDLVLTADVDMAPLDHTFFDRWDPLFVLRADMYQPVDELLSGRFRFPLCYVGARAAFWRKAFGLVPDDLDASLKSITCGLSADSIDFDEEKATATILVHTQGDLARAEDRVWQRGDLTLYGATDWPGAKHLRMLSLADVGRVEGAADFHMPRPITADVIAALEALVPDEAAWLSRYWQIVTDRLTLCTTAL